MSPLPIPAYASPNTRLPSLPPRSAFANWLRLATSSVPSLESDSSAENLKRLQVLPAPSRGRFCIP